MTQDQIKQLLISLFPEGSADLYKTGNGDVIGGWLNSLAGSLKDVMADRFDAFVRNMNPATIDENIPDWEAATGLSNSKLATFGNDTQRRNAVLAVLRMHGAFSLDDIRAILQPYFLYADPSQIDILEPSRSQQRTAHTYTGGILGPAALVEESVIVADDPRVSPAGVILEFEITTTRLDSVVVALRAPNGQTYQRLSGYLDTEATSVTAESYRICWPEFAGLPIKGDWRVLFASQTGDNITIGTWSIFVEGIGNVYDGAGNVVSQGLGAALFTFTAVADLSLVGADYDIEGGLKALTRWKPAHTQGGITTTNVLGNACAIPDTENAIPNNAIPC